MKHFWLDDGQQAIMDAATSTASDYGYIGLVDTPTRWQKPVQVLVGGEVADESHFRIHNITHDVNFHSAGKGIKLKSAVRLTAIQAMMLKLRVAGSGTGFVIDDPTGEQWGNIANAANERWKVTHLNWHVAACRQWSIWDAHRGFQNLILKRPFGPTLESVGDTCKGMPKNWARAFIMFNKDDTHHFSLPAEAPSMEIATKRQGFVAEAMTICRDLLDMRNRTVGKEYALEWVLDCQEAVNRQLHGIEGDPGELL